MAETLKILLSNFVKYGKIKQWWKVLRNRERRFIFVQ